MRIGSRTRVVAALVATMVSLCAPAGQAAGTARRAAHTASLLPTGDVLIAGGMNQSGTPQATAELYLASTGGGYRDAASMSVARASHTATVMANGRLLVAGGVDNGGVVRADAEVYDPATDTWSALISGLRARYNHTATLLNGGSVLLCGGQDGSGGVLATCDYFTPTGGVEPSGATCAASGGCATAAPSLTFARALHTATLLKDGKVWIAGGWNPAAAATNGWLTTSEKFDPSGGGSFGSAHNLSQARGLHTATMMGDGKVLVTGGFNGAESLGNRGFLDAQEIYDPVSDAISPAASLQTRRAMQSAALSADGSVLFFGGLGNIATTYANLTFSATVGTLTDAFSGQLSTGNSTTPDGQMSLVSNVFLSQPVVGRIVDGDILYSTPSVRFNSGVAYFSPGDPNNASAGLHSSLAGAVVGCTAAGTCGSLNTTTTFPLQNLNKGKLYFSPRGGLTLSGTASGGTLRFTGTLTTGNSLPLDPGSSIRVSSVTLSLPVELLGATISSGTFDLASGTLVQSSSYAVSLTGGRVAVPSTTTVVSDGAGGAEIVFDAYAQNLAGFITWAGGDQSYSVAGPQPAQQPNTAPSTSFNGTLRYVASQVDISGLPFSIDVATVIIRSMIFASPEYYYPASNQATLTAATSLLRPTTALLLLGGGSPQAPQAMFGRTVTLLPSNDLFLTGGYHCSSLATTSCGALIAGERHDLVELVANDNSTTAGALVVRRALHTATLLPNRTILAAGGTNGASLLATAELYDPVTKAARATNGPMSVPRDQHTATLLPNGRVLIAGGFTTTAVSSDSTGGAEIYYPDTGLFLPTASMSVARRGHTATLMSDGNVIVAGGIARGGTITPTVELYRSTAAAWETLTPIPVQRTAHTATLLPDGRLLIVGGTNAGGPLSSVYAYSPSSGWSALSPLPHALYGHTATLLFDGRVLVAGGNDGFGEYDASYLYTPASDSWAATSAGSALLKARFGHNATLLPDGAVMISGGSTRSGVVPTDVEVFHVSASSWVSGGVTLRSGARAFHTMTLAADGGVYALGGGDGAIGGTGSSLLSAIDRIYFTTAFDAYTKNAPPSVRQSTISALSPSLISSGGSLTVTGRWFRGGTEASGGGSAAANSSFHAPRLVLQRVDSTGGGDSQSGSGFAVDLTTQIYLNSANFASEDTSLTVSLPLSASRLPAGWYGARVGVNGVYSDAAFVQAGPAKPALAPASSAGTTLGVSSLSWTWSAVAGVDGYDVYQATSGVFLGTAPAAASPSFLQTGLAANTTGAIAIAGYTLSGDGPLALSASFYTLAKAPTSLQIASVTSNSLLLEWSANGDTPGTIYEVSASTDGFVNSFELPVPDILGLTDTFATIGQLEASTTYTFRLRAFNTAGVASDYSATVSTFTGSLVSAVVGVAERTDSIQWSWYSPGSAINYNVYDAVGGQLLAAPTVTTYRQTGLGVNTRHSIRVAAVTVHGEGPSSSSPPVYTLAAVPGLISPQLLDLTTGSVTMHWTFNGNPNGTLYQATNVEYDGANVITTTSTTTGFAASFTDLLPNRLLMPSVRAFNNDGVPTAPLAAGQVYTSARAPASVTVVNTTPVSVTVTWDTNSNSTSTVYAVTYSSDDFVSDVSTAVPFSAGLTDSTATVTGLITSTTYWIRVQAMNGDRQPGAFSSAISTRPNNGGAPFGSLAGTLTSIGASELVGYLGNGRYVGLRAPNGAFSSDTRVTVSSYNVSGSLCPNGLNVAFSISDEPALQPLRPLYLNASYSAAELGASAPERVSLSRYEPASGTCVPLETAFDTAHRLFTVQLNHFSLYQLVAVPAAATTSAARVFPNPFRAASDGYVTIDRIPPGSRVRVTTLRGETLLDQAANGAGLVTWAATNGAARSVASGLYLIVVESGGSQKIMKLAVIR